MQTSLELVLFLLGLAVVVLVNIGTLWVAFQTENYMIWYAVVLPVTLAWIIFYSYWTLVKRRIRLREWPDVGKES